MFNAKKPYGLIVGHPEARYEQEGVLYRSNGTAVGRKKEEPATIVEEESAEEFLLRVLKGGPITRSAVYREAEKKSISWEDVKTAAGKIGVGVRLRKNVEVWHVVEA